MIVFLPGPPSGRRQGGLSGHNPVPQASRRRHPVNLFAYFRCARSTKVVLHIFRADYTPRMNIKQLEMLAMELCRYY